VHRSYGHLYVVGQQPGHRAAGRSASEQRRIFRRLAAQWASPRPASGKPDEQIAAQGLHRTATAGYDWNTVRERGWWRLNVPTPYAPFASGHFPTPSGRCEFYSEQLAAQGLEPLPDYVAPYESRAARPSWRGAFLWR